MDLEPYVAKDIFYQKCDLPKFNAIDALRNTVALVTVRDNLIERHQPGECRVHWDSAREKLVEQYAGLNVEPALECIEAQLKGFTNIDSLADLNLLTAKVNETFRSLLVQDMTTLTKAHYLYEDPAVQAVIDFYLQEEALMDLQEDYRTLLSEYSRPRLSLLTTPRTREYLQTRLHETAEKIENLQAKLRNIYVKQSHSDITDDDLRRKFTLGIEIKKPEIRPDFVLLGL